jgi:hypothetical protein
MQYSIKIIDNSNGTIRTFEDVAASKSYPEFVQYVRAISTHVLQTIRAMPECAAVSESATADMVFVYTPVMTSRGAVQIVASKKGMEPVYGTPEKSLESPWASMTFSKNARRIQFYGAFYWNQRQFLADQVSLDGVADLTPTSPVTQDEFYKYGAEYRKLIEKHMLMQHEKNLPIQRMSKQETFAKLGKTVPLDLLWLFRCSPLGGRAPFGLGVMSTMRTLEKKQLDGYIALTNALTASLFHQKTQTSHYGAIKDTSTFFDVKTYPHFTNGLTE